MLTSSSARAEVELAEKDGWVFKFDGRINAFMNTGWGNEFPAPTMDPNGNTHEVMGGNAMAAAGARVNVGWLSNSQSDQNHKFFAMRMRSGFYSNILGFSVSKQVNETTILRGYVAFWANIETIGRDKWAPIIAEAREGYVDIEGRWGTVTVGRSLGWLGRSSYDIDRAYGHGYALGIPCTDSAGPGCGHIGTGVLFPGYSAGVGYATPQLGPIMLHVGVYDPVVFSGEKNDWSRAGTVRPEGALVADIPLGSAGRIVASVDGAYQTLSRIQTTADPNDPMIMTQRQLTTSIWGMSGGGRLEIGPLRLGGSFFRGRGIGLGYALQLTSATEDNQESHPTTGPANATYGLRTFTGYYGQGTLVFGRWRIGGGFGRALVDQLPADRANPEVSVFRYQQGISGVVTFKATDAVILSFDYFNYQAFWYGAPQAEMGGTNIVGRLKGETQALQFVSVGTTYRW